MTEQELIKACIEKQPLAQRELYSRYVNEMTRLVMRYIPDSQESFDSLSNGFFKILKDISSFEYRGEGSLRAWMSRIMVNEALMKLRKRKQMLEVSLDEKIDDAQFSYEEYDTSYLYECIQSLPDGARTVFNLVGVEGYSHKESAKMLGIAESSSRSQLVYARQKLKEMLTKEM